MTKQTVKRDALAETLMMFGGMMNLMRSIANLFIKTYQVFSIEKSMIKKMYSFKDNRKKRGKKSTNITDDELDEHMDAD